MTVTTSYSHEESSQFFIPNSSDNDNLLHVDLATLSNGGFVGAGIQSGSHTDLAIYDSTRTVTAQPNVVNSGTAPVTAVAQLHNGNIVNVMPVGGGDASYAIVNINGVSVETSTALGFAGSGADHIVSVDVAGLADEGFVVAMEQQFSPGDHDIYVMLRGDDGSPVSQITVDASTHIDFGPSIAGLNDGGFAVAWTRIDQSTGDTSIRYAVYNEDGSVRHAAANLDSNGDTNIDVSVVALESGGFGVVYQDNGWGQPDVTFAKLNAAGNLQGFLDVIDPIDSTEQTEASATLLANGYVAVSYTEPFLDKIIVQVVDPATMELIGSEATMTSLGDQGSESSIAAFGESAMVVAWAELGGGNLAREVTLVRTTTGDSAANVLTGDELKDVMDAGFGNDSLYGGASDDELNGEGDSDLLFGGEGDDTINGGDGNDYMAGGAGGDAYNGGTGNNTVSYLDAASAVVVDFTNLSNNTGEADGDSYVSAFNLQGSNFNDSLTGNSSNNSFQGGDGEDTLIGNDGTDNLRGGGDDDTIYGGLKADKLLGGSGVDVFAYGAVNESTSITYDRIKKFDANIDKIGLPGFVVGDVDPKVHTGTLDSSSFNQNLADAIGAGELAAHHAVLFTPDAGDLAGRTFLVVDSDNSAGYGAGTDFVFYLSRPKHLNHLGTEDFVDANARVAGGANALITSHADLVALALTHIGALDALGWFTDEGWL